MVSKQVSGNDFFSSDSFYIFISTIPLGIFFGVLYDLFRIKRIFTFSNKIVLFIDDIIYMLLFCGIFILFSFEINYGNIRWYMPLNTVFCLFLYKIAVGNKIVKIIAATVNVVKMFFIKVFYTLLKPFKLLLVRIYKLMVNFLCKTWKFCKKFKNVFSFRLYRCRMMRKAKLGFKLQELKRRK